MMKSVVLALISASVAYAFAPVSSRVTSSWVYNRLLSNFLYIILIFVWFFQRLIYEAWRRRRRECRLRHWIPRVRSIWTYKRNQRGEILLVRSSTYSALFLWKLSRIFVPQLYFVILQISLPFTCLVCSKVSIRRVEARTRGHACSPWTSLHIQDYSPWRRVQPSMCTCVV